MTDGTIVKLDSAFRVALAAVWPVAVWGGVLAAIVLVSQLLGDIVTQLIVVNALITVVLVVGLYIFVGNSGILSFGHSSFMLIGAYTAAIFTIPAEQRNIFLRDVASTPVVASLTFNQPLALLAGGLVAAGAGAVISVPIMRLSGIQASIATLAVLVIVQIVALNWVSVTGGLSAMNGYPNDTTTPVALVGAVAAIAGASLFQVSKSGRFLRASREDDVAAASMGVNVRLQRRIGFVVSAFFVGLGGALWAHFVGAFNPTSFYLTITFQTMAVLIIGGINSLSGAVLGTLIVTLLTEAFHRLPSDLSVGTIVVSVPPTLADIAVAITLLLILILRPQGLTGGREVPLPQPLWLKWRNWTSVQRRTSSPGSDAAHDGGK